MRIGRYELYFEPVSRVRTPPASLGLSSNQRIWPFNLGVVRRYKHPPSYHASRHRLVRVSPWHYAHIVRFSRQPPPRA